MIQDDPLETPLCALLLPLSLTLLVTTQRTATSEGRLLAYELGTLADCVKTALTSPDPFNMGIVIYYVTLGYAMPPSVHQNLVNCIKRWFTDNTRESFQEKFPWLIMSEATWTSILTNMNAWINPDEHYSPNLHTVKEILALYKPAGEDSARNAMNGLIPWELETT